ncbi:MAG: Gfo/Idh/MocA family oxidoreductase [Gemmatimonadetes bacterium]|nr:Gfo/Idh/MocA family oxidoreductase [Gemmatimonadota bacterium]MBT4612208.1 Gfo/Idh/MocA family oxidoreductase [Gemmatimonadota bacterium]MBT5060143.1 Gfo/Idh/MocA family oxidoreductase [Gemmatimonadota bacterium]MBT5141431.1 Gfo/Idh/MocA family oxidoreductase [Gemmatimonadota bacterium]MBT5590664.1 Gfo/Idh/MocA family oxidoreductase [Gemmatimonadota bacterium]
MSSTRVGFIGLGHISIHAHLPGLRPLVESGDVELSAFCDISEEALAEQAAAFGAKTTYTDHRQMFEQEDLDAVYINLPPTLHTDQVTLAAEKGIHTFVEKPVSLDMAQAASFSQQIEKAGVVSQVGFMSRYYPSAEHVVELLRERTPRHVQISLFYSGKPVRWWTSRYEECGGSFVENTIHMVDLIRYFLGDIADVSAFYMWREPGEGPEMMNMPHVYDVNYRFASGVVGNATTSRVLTDANGAGRREVLIVCDDALIEWSTNKVTVNGETTFEADAKGREAFALQAAAFIEAVKAEDPSRMRSPYGSSLNSLAAVLGANASAERDGQRLALADVEASEVAWNPRHAAGHGTPTLE